MNDVLQKGDAAPLLYTKQGRKRITVGISWDTPEIMPERPEAFVSNLDEGTSDYDVEMDVTVGFIQDTYDLDLICLIYNDMNELIDAVSPAPEENVDLSGAIYHSGDDTAGVSAGDDEQISIELEHLPDNIHHMVFISVIQSGHTYGEVLNAQCRIADGKTDNNLLKFSLGQYDPERKNKTACIMASIFRHPTNSEWYVKRISEFRIDKEIENWGDEAQKSL